jgi:amidase
VIGFKPTPGLVPLAGGASDHWLGMTAFGPLTGTVADTALMLGVLSGKPFDAPSNAKGLRVAISTAHPNRVSVDGEIVEAVESTGVLLENLGHHVASSSPPYPADLGLRFMRRWLPGIARDAKGLEAKRLEQRTRSMAAVGRLLERLHLDAPASADAFRTKALEWFGAYDVVVLPVIAAPPVPLGRWNGKGWIATTLGVADWIMTPAWNIVGCPAASIPAGLSKEGLPIAVQVVARPGQDALLLGVLRQIEAARPRTRWNPAEPLGTS